MKSSRDRAIVSFSNSGVSIVISLSVIFFQPPNWERGAGTPNTPLTTALRHCWILLICTGMVTFRRTQWPQTHRTFDSWIILWNAIGETRVLDFNTFWFFGIRSGSVLLHIIPRSFGVVHCHYESLEWIIYFLRKSEVFLIIQNTYNQWSFQVCFENDWQIRKWDGTDLENIKRKQDSRNLPIIIWAFSQKSVS